MCILCVLLWYDIFCCCADVCMTISFIESACSYWWLFNCRCSTPLRLRRRRRGIWSTLQGFPTCYLWWFVSFCIVVTFYIKCFTLYIKDIHRSRDLAISTMHHTFDNLQASVHVATYYTRSCETNHVWLYRYMEYFHEA